MNSAAIAFLYSVILTKGIDQIKSNYQDKIYLKNNITIILVEGLWVIMLEIRHH